jgi:acetoacetyl-CoA synthetase
VNLELSGGRHYMPLFVLMNEGAELTDEVKTTIKKTLRKDYSPRHVPDEIIVVEDIPYTISGKKLEAPVKKILMGMPIDKAANPDSMRNPESLGFFVQFAEGIE